MLITAKTNGERTKEEREILAKNLIILTAVYEEVRSLLSNERDKVTKKYKYGGIGEKNYLPEMLGTKRSNLSRLCHVRELGSLTKEMVKIPKIDKCKELEMVFYDKEIWYKTEDIDKYEWNELGIEEKRIETNTFSAEIRKMIQKDIYRIFKSEDKICNGYEEVVKWVIRKIVEFYGADQGAEDKVKDRMKGLKEIDFSILDGCTNSTLEEFNAVIQEKSKMIDAILLCKKENYELRKKQKVNKK